jgi:two-component system, OmpR family, sensor kinase
MSRSWCRDEHRLHQMLANLLSNAAKHTPPGTTVALALALGKAERGRRWPGIPPDLQSTPFERFVRADSSRSRAAGSTGLGQAIVDAVTAAHGGSVDLTSGPGRTRLSSRSPALTRPPLSPRPGSPAPKQTSARPSAPLHSNRRE